MSDFLRKKSALITFYALIIVLFFIVIHLFALSIFSDSATRSAVASDVISFKQEILPMDPVEETYPIVPSISNEDDDSDDKKSSNNDFYYRIVESIDKEDVELSNNLIEITPITTFGGVSAYPNSRLLLEVDSDKFFVSVLTDSRGRWIWTNNTHPLDTGEHRIISYNFSPFEISGTKDVFAEEYRFKVVESTKDNRSIVNLSDLGANRSDIENSLLSDILKDKADNHYLFDIILINKDTYLKGDDLSIALSIKHLNREDNEKEAIVTYEIFKDDGKYGTLVSKFEDSLVLRQDSSFLKKIKFKESVLEGEYFIKTTLAVSDKKHIQINSFKITSEEIVKVGATVITRDSLVRIIFNNLALLLAIFILLLLIMIFEYKRFMKEGAVGRGFLDEKGFLNN